VNIKQNKIAVELDELREETLATQATVELGVLPKFHNEAFLKIHEYPSADDFEGKKRLHGV